MPQLTEMNPAANDVKVETPSRVAPAKGDGSKHVPSLDGLRVPAVVAVMLFHVGFPFCRPLGALGVDLFFVLSGFLITTLMVLENERNGRIHLGRFWGRRFLRLMPAYYTYAVFITLSIFVFHWGQTTSGRVQGWSVGDMVLSIWFYFINYAPMDQLWANSWWILHLWSLAVEEQFYLIWPPLLLLALRWNRGIGWLLVLAIAINRCFYPEYEREFRLDSRGLGIMLGCAVALSLRGVGSERFREFVAKPWIRPVAVGAIAVIAAVFTILMRAGWSVGNLQLYSVPAFDLCFVALVASLYYGPSDLISRLLSLRPLVYLGKISYGIYLYHMICQVVVWDVLLAGIESWPGAVKYPLRLAAFAGLSIGVAAFSYHFLERPFLKLKDRFR